MIYIATQGCVCNCKDTNLKAIHNTTNIHTFTKNVVFATAKILIWKQFTTICLIIRCQSRCVCNCKDTNLKAIHNKQKKTNKNGKVVFATAKILIWKQFTTMAREETSQRSCVCNCKDTNLKAIHNMKPSRVLELSVVFATAKILIWKQFTTTLRLKISRMTLCLQLQRY